MPSGDAGARPSTVSIRSIHGCGTRCAATSRKRFVCDARLWGVEGTVDNDRGAGTWAWLAAAASALVLVALTVAVVRDGGPLAGELRVVRWWQSLGEPAPTLAEFVRATTSTEACLVASLLPAAWLVRRHGRRAAPAILIVLCSTLVVQPLMKELVDRPRPTAEQVEVRAEHTSMSFPSGHSLSTTTTWGAAALYALRRSRFALAAGLALPVVVTGMSSSIQGVHWPSDALAGTIVGGLAAWYIVEVCWRESNVGRHDRATRTWGWDLLARKRRGTSRSSQQTVGRRD